MALPPRKRRKLGNAGRASGFTPEDDLPEDTPGEQEARPVAEEVPETKQLRQQTAAEYFLSKQGKEQERSAEDKAADEWVPSGEDIDPIPTPVLLRMQLFATHYLTSLNGADAARKAGYAPAYAKNRAAMLLAHPTVIGMIREQHKALMAKIGVTQERVWAEIAYAAFLDPAQLFGEDGELLPMGKIPEQARRAISGYKVKTATFGDDGESIEREVKFGGKDAALDKLLRLTGMLKEKELRADDIAEAMIERLQRGRQRAIEGAANADS